MKRIIRDATRVLSAVTLLLLWDASPAQVYNQIGSSGYWNTPAGGTAVNALSLGPLATTPFPALLQVRGDQITGTSAIQNNTFETRGDVDEQQFWRMYRGSSDASHQWGRLYVTDANTNLGFNLQQVQQGGSLWLRNVRNRPNGTATGQTDKIFTGNGLRLIDDAPFNLNGYLTNGRCGYVAIGHTFSMDQTGMSAIPWTRLHLTHQNNVDNTASGNTAVWQRRLGYRPWMRNGMMITGNKDQMYVGHKYRYTGSTPQGNETLDASDAVIQWADTTGSPQTTDNFRLLFTTSPDGSSTGGAKSVEGLELLRARPFYNANNEYEGYVGIGDWFANGQVPTERFDILNGKMRHRQLPTDAEMTAATKAMVVDANGIVGWRTWPTGGGSSGCEWFLGGGTNSNDVNTAVGLSTTCPNESNYVNIGTKWNSHEAKLNVYMHGSGSGTNPAAISAEVRAETDGIGNMTGVKGVVGSTMGIPPSLQAANHYGVSGYAANATNRNHGMEAMAVIESGKSNLFDNTGVTGYAETHGTSVNNIGIHAGATVVGTALNCQAFAGEATGVATYNYGLSGKADGTLASTTNYGVYGRGGSTVPSSVCYGVYGETIGTDVYDPTQPVAYQHTKWAGYFPGDTYVGGTIFSPSDEQFKQNVQDLSGDAAVDRLQHLQPKTYVFDQDQFGFMHLAKDEQLGLLAQNVEEVLPQLVARVHQPARLDSAGTVVTPEVDFRALNYQGFIPLLIAGFKAQQATIASLQDQINGCCAQAPIDQRSMTTGSSDLNTERLLISPNPFTDHTTVKYYVPQPARVSLQVSDSMGKPVSTLREEQAMAGSFTYEWNTQSLAPGTYFVALLVDGNVVVKKAVKLGEH